MNTSDRNAAALASPISVSVAGTSYLANPPTPSDIIAYREEMKRQCRAAGTVEDPIVAVASTLEKINPMFHAVFAEAAVKLRAGGGVEPSDDAVTAQLYTPDGAAFMLWLLASKNHPGLKIEDVRSKIPDTVVARDVMTQLGKLLSPDEKKETGQDGSTGSQTVI